jgi:TPR repeat protein
MKKVVALYEKAAQKSHKLAIKGLILIYKMGSMDVLPDKEKADYWIQKLQIN